ncbi:MAG TPA: hypothetical protein PKK33_11205, partial [Candidatus Cloacimonadota bacterium]|nr:hypothetical protein [Candidatus Cloacimonadota bacterium]
MLRNPCPFSAGISVRFQQELLSVFSKNMHLITNNNEEYIENSKEAFKEMADSLESLGIIFTYEFV